MFSFWLSISSQQGRPYEPNAHLGLVMRFEQGGRPTDWSFPKEHSLNPDFSMLSWLHLSYARECKLQLISFCAWMCVICVWGGACVCFVLWVKYSRQPWVSNLTFQLQLRSLLLHLRCILDGLWPSGNSISAFHFALGILKLQTDMDHQV